MIHHLLHHIAEEFYLQILQDWLSVLDEKIVKKIIFLSSTSIYQNVSDIVDEKSAIVETSLMAQAESLILASKIPSVTLRLGGLMGGDRFVAKYFSGRRNDGANCPVNYVHKDDVVALCALTVEKINKGIFSLNEGKDTNIEPYIYCLLVIYLISTLSSL